MYADLIDDMTDTAEILSANVQIKDAEVSITVKDGYIQSYSIDYDVVVEASGVTMRYGASASVTYNNPGKTVTITPPAGYQSFPSLID